MNQERIAANFEFILGLTKTMAEKMPVRSTTLKKQALYYKLTMITVSAGITLVLGLKFNHSEVIALCLSSLLIVLTSMDQYAKITVRHLSHQRRINVLLKLVIDLEIYLSNYKGNYTEEKLEEFKERIYNIIDDINDEVTSDELRIKEELNALSSK